MRIPQRLPVFSILFLIYINEIFFLIEEKLPSITCVLFVDNLGFLISGYSISIVRKLLEKIGKITLECGANNSITYFMSQTEIVLFSKAHYQKLAKQISETQLKFDGETVFFKKKAIQWLGVWLDSYLDFAAHINERIKKAKAAKLRIKGLSKTYGLCPALV